MNQESAKKIINRRMFYASKKKILGNSAISRKIIIPDKYLMSYKSLNWNHSRKYSAEDFGSVLREL